MRLVGYNDLQARSAYQPTIQKQGNRYIAYVGHHGGTPDVPKPVNKLNGQAEYNGTSIIDVTDPAQPKYLAHIPGLEGNYEDGGAQMVRVCDGKILPKGDPSKTYMLRVFGGRGHEMWDVTDPAKPALLTKIIEGLEDAQELVGMRHRHRLPRVRCAELARAPHNSGLRPQRSAEACSYPRLRPGRAGTRRDRRGTDGTARRRFNRPTRQSDLFRPRHQQRRRAPDRRPREAAQGPKEPTPDNLHYPEISRVEMLPFNGAHTVFPMLQMPVAESPGQGRQGPGHRDDRGRAIRNECQEERQIAVRQRDGRGQAHGGLEFLRP